MMSENDRQFVMGNPKVHAAGFSCCGKPRGCTMMHEGCAYLRHPWKRAMVLNDPTAPCQMETVELRCSLTHGHAGACVMVER